MPNLRISQLASLNLPFTGSEVVAIVRQPNTVTNKVTVANLAAYITASIPAMISASIGGGNQNLQSVVTNGYSATSSNGTHYGRITLDPFVTQLSNVIGGASSTISLGSGNAAIDGTNSVELTAPFIDLNSPRVYINRVEATGSLLGTASYSQTASYVNIVGSGITVNYNGSQIQLTGSAGGAGNLQSVTTAGNQTSQSVNITGSLTNGFNVTAVGMYSHAEGSGSRSVGLCSHAEGFYTTAIGTLSHTEGGNTIAIGTQAHAEGAHAIASGAYSHAEGNGTRAYGGYCHSEGISTLAMGQSSHAEGVNTIAIGHNSHAEGDITVAAGFSSHAEGGGPTANGSYSHAEGWYTTAIGFYSHTEGESTTAIGTGSHAEGLATIASASYQHVQGQYNIAMNGTGSFVIGNGINNSSRSNLVYASGSQVQITGSICIQNTAGTPSNTATPNRWIPFIHNGQAGFIPFYV